MRLWAVLKKIVLSPSYEFSPAGFSEEFVSFEKNFASGHDYSRRPAHRHLLVRIVIDTHEVRFSADRVRTLGIPDDNVSIAPHCDRALTGEQAHQFRRSC